MEWEDLFLLLKSSNDAGSTVSKLRPVVFGIYSGDKKCHEEKSVVEKQEIKLP